MRRQEDKIIILFKELLEKKIKELKKDDNTVRLSNQIACLNEIIESGMLDSTTLDLMKVYLKDEEEDMYWSEQQLDLCKMIGKQNYLTQLLINDQN